MRYIVMHKVDDNMEAGGPPSETIIREMGQLVQESLKSGVFTNGAGLHRSAMRLRLEYAGGARTVTPGPFKGKNELVAAFVMIRASSMDQAIQRADRVAGALGDAEIEIGPVVEPWDLGMAPKPANLQFGRFLLLIKGDARSERGWDAKTRAALAQVEKQLRDEDAFLAADTLAPSARGARLPSAAKGKRAWVDGPFTESKELIAGFSLLDVPSRAEALAWADRYAAILGDNEVEVREILEPV